MSQPIWMEPVRKKFGNRLTAIMQVRNEADRFLREVLSELSEFVDDIVILDDASTDGTASLCRSFSKVSLLQVMDMPLFHKEWLLRSKLWQAAVSTKPDWILSVDADEFYEDKAKDAMRKLIDHTDYDWVGFRFFDFWGGTTHYREDAHWSIHKRHTRTLVRYLPGYHYFYPKMNHHVPRLSLTYEALPGFLAEYRVKHYGWAVGPEERYRKYLRYKERDPDGIWGSPEQYESILDPNPRLIEWKEDGAG